MFIVTSRVFSFPVFKEYCATIPAFLKSLVSRIKNGVQGCFAALALFFQQVKSAVILGRAISPRNLPVPVPSRSPSSSPHLPVHSLPSLQENSSPPQNLPPLRLRVNPPPPPHITPQTNAPLLHPLPPLRFAPVVPPPEDLFLRYLRENQQFLLGSQRHTLLDIPVDIEAIKQMIERGDRPPLSQHLTPRHFIQLVDQLPDHKMAIAEFAKEWAKNRPLIIDPQHRYFEIFQAALQLREQIPGGRGASEDYQTYRCRDEMYYGTDASSWLYLIYSMLGFQEIERPENLELITKLDSGGGNAGTNPAYVYQRELSKIFAYPNAGSGSDIKNKLQVGVGALWEAYVTARDRHKLLEFFTQGFQNNEFCFDARVRRLQEFTLSLLNGDWEEFNVKVRPYDPLLAKVGEYYRVFRNTQLLAWARRNLQPQETLSHKYQESKRLLLLRPNDPGYNPNFIADFESEHVTRDKFYDYLTREGHPIRQEALAIFEQQEPLLPVVHTVSGKQFPEVSLSQIPSAYREPGKVLTARIMGLLFPAKVHKVDVARGILTLDLRGEPLTQARCNDLLDQLGL